MVGVFDDDDIRRIKALPTRPHDWTEEELEEAVDLLTEHLKKPEGTMRLKRIQARALVEAADHGKLVGEIGAGQGKFGLSALLFTIWEAQRGLLVVPANLRIQTMEEWAKWSRHWRLLPLYDLDAGAVAGPQVRVISYSSLSTVRFATFLEEYQPDVIVGDEAHNWARLKSARSKRTFRYIRTKRKAKASVRFVPLSGTMRRKKITECAHLYEAALEDQSPYPTHYPTLEQVSNAIDEGVRDDARLSPGALSELCTPEELAEGLDGLRRGVRRRVVSTPGVIATSESAVDVPLTFQVREIQVPPEVEAAMRNIREAFQLPTGENFDGGITAWNHAREVACGFAYHWDPPPPPEWKKAKTKWLDFVSKAMEKPLKGVHLDSPLQVWNAVAQGKFGDPARIEPWTSWKAIKDTFEPNPIPHWISDFLVRDAEDWALKTGGIVWISHTSAFSDRGAGEGSEDDIGALFKRIPYFGAGKAGEAIKTYKGPCVASVRAHSTGKNLIQWNRALWLCMPSSGSAVEQLAARHHRIGQTADAVHIELYLHSREMFNALMTAQSDARYMESMNGNIQKITSSVILTADGHSFDPQPYLERMENATTETDPMWAKNGGKG